MATKRTLVVFGATGMQGGSVINSILTDPTTAESFHIRAITRDTSKGAATALAKKGVTVIKADLDDKESLREAMRDAYAVFAMTNFHERFSKAVEMQQGFNIADVAKEMNIQHLIWSSLPHVAKISNNKYTKVLHFDGKALVEEYIRKIGIPATYIKLGVFMPYVLRLLSLDTSTASGDKTYKMCLPSPFETKWPLISVKEDVGNYVKAILLNRERLLGKQICAAEKEYSMAEIIDALREAGLSVIFQQLSDEKYKESLTEQGLPAHFVEDMSENVKFIAEFGFFGGVGLEAGHEILAESLVTFAEWIGRSPEVATMR